MSTLSLDDATVIRRLKNHVVQCKCCQDALSKEDKEDGLEEPTHQNHPAERRNQLPAQPGSKLQ